MNGTADSELVDSPNLVALSNSDPHKLIALLRSSSGAIHNSASAADCRALAIAHRVLGDLESSTDAASEGRERALAVGDQRSAAMCNLTSSPVLAQLGRVDESLALLAASEAHLRGLDLAELRFQRAGILGLVADYRPAKTEYSKALRGFRQHDVTIWQADALMNRGLMSAYLGEAASARRDLTEARRIFEAEQDLSGVAGAVHNLALTDLVSGDPVRSLLGFESSRELFAKADIPYDTFLADHAEALLAVGLSSEATDLLGEAIVALESSGHVLEAATQRMVAAQALANQRQHDQASRQVQLAADSFTAHGQLHRAKRAALIRLSIDLEADQDPDHVERSARELGSYFLDQAKLPDWQLDASLLQARAMLATGRTEPALQLLKSLGRRPLSFPQRIERARIVAEGHQQRGEAGQALRATRRGLRLVDEARLEASSSELHDALSQHLVSLSEIGLAVLLETGRAREALQLAEQAARTMKIVDGPTAPPPSLVEYRAVSRAAQEADNEGRDPRAIRRRQRALAQSVRRERIGTQRRQTVDVAGPGRITMRRYVIASGQLWALDLHQGRVSATELCGVDQAARLAKEMLFRTKASLDGADIDPLRSIADELDHLIGRPGEQAVGGETLALSLNSNVPAIPFGLLPSLTPCAWVMASDSLSHPVVKGLPKRAVIIAGPDLEFAEAERRRLGRLYPEAATLKSGQATTEAVSSAVDGAGIVHIAAHSSLNRENPLFSSIQLSDGDFTLHALSGVAKPPRVVVLASCESAASSSIGTATVGLTRGMLRLGVGAVVGTMCEIPDSTETVKLMTDLHQQDLSDVGQAVSATRNRETSSEYQRLLASCLVPAV